MPDVADLCNEALGMIGAKSIAAIDDGSINANHCLRLYPPLRDAILRSNHWTCAKKRAKLAQDATAPLYEFAFAYTLPTAPWCLKVIAYAGANTDTSTLIPVYDGQQIREGIYKIEGRKLLTNDAEVYIGFLARLENPDEWDALLYQVIVTWLAGKLAAAITKDIKFSTGLIEQAMNLYLPLATAVDGQQNSIEPFRVDDLKWGR